MSITHPCTDPSATDDNGYWVVWKTWSACAVGGQPRTRAAVHRTIIDRPECLRSISTSTSYLTQRLQRVRTTKLLVARRRKTPPLAHWKGGGAYRPDRRGVDTSA